MFLNSKWDVFPETLGTFHISGIAFAILCVVIGFVLGKKYQKKSEDDLCKFLLIIGVIFIVLHIIQKALKSIDLGYFPWSEIDLSVCHFSMYFFVVVGIIKKGKVRDCLISFLGLGTFCFSISYFIMPIGSLQEKYIFSGVLSFAFYAVLLGASVMVMVSQKQYAKPAIKKFLQTYIVFIFIATVDVIYNEIIYRTMPQFKDVNLFGLSAHLPSYYPVLNQIVDPTTSPFPLYLIGFAIYGFLAGLMFYIIFRMLNIITNKITKERLNNE